MAEALSSALPPTAMRRVDACRQCALHARRRGRGRGVEVSVGVGEVGHGIHDRAPAADGQEYFRSLPASMDAQGIRGRGALFGHTKAQKAQRFGSVAYVPSVANSSAVANRNRTGAEMIPKFSSAPLRPCAMNRAQPERNQWPRAYTRQQAYSAGRPSARRPFRGRQDRRRGGRGGCAGARGAGSGLRGGRSGAAAGAVSGHSGRDPSAERAKAAPPARAQPAWDDPRAWRAESGRGRAS